MQKQALLIDETPLFNTLLIQALHEHKYALHLVEREAIALELLRQSHFDLIVIGRGISSFPFHELCVMSRELQPQAFLLLLTAPTGAGTETLHPEQWGADATMRRPLSAITVTETLLKAQRRCHTVARSSAVTEYRSLVLPQEMNQRFVTESHAMQTFISQLLCVADSKASIFLTGESGTGKEVVAEMLHALSPRRAKPLIRINCAAIPDTLIESEFFGHEKGAFTGACHRRIGRFELAHEGTLLLDEISESPLLFQAKLLRAVQQQQFERLGGHATLSVDVRLISTSNRDMQDAISRKLFRDDLFYRLNVIPLHVPPLRERKADILPLAEQFLRHFAAENNRPIKTLSASAVRALVEYPWPGNVRELANTIERTSLLHAGDCIHAKDLLFHHATVTASTLSLAQLERKTILEALATAEHNRTHAAKKLGISIRTLRNKLRQYDAECI